MISTYVVGRVCECRTRIVMTYARRRRCARTGAWWRAARSAWRATRAARPPCSSACPTRPPPTTCGCCSRSAGPSRTYTSSARSSIKYVSTFTQTIQPTDDDSRLTVQRTYVPHYSRSSRKVRPSNAKRFFLN